MKKKFQQIRNYEILRVTFCFRPHSYLFRVIYNNNIFMYDEEEKNNIFVCGSY